ncbi:MAG TPA: formate/nitrite transporter family protein [Gaiellaceae bacterium]|nr:formate/nitrite transporter family protein [Gaiellaceae bacterium]
MAESESHSARPQAEEILDRVISDAEEELDRSSAGLAISGFAAGLTMGLSALGVAVLAHLLPHEHWAPLVAYLLYPLGFVAVIIGRAQLFTENTLYPVVLLLDRREGYLGTLRLWVVVFCANVAGVVVFAVLMTEVHTIARPTQEVLVELGLGAATNTWGHVFWTGVIGGWLIALVAWLVEGAEMSIGQIAVIWLLTYLVGVGGFAHCIASSGEILAAAFDGALSGWRFLSWLSAATLGNVAGGVLIVALLNYGQVMAGGGRRGGQGASA